MPIRLAIASDTRLYRESVQQLLSKTVDVRVVASTNLAGIPTLPVSRVDVLLLDIAPVTGVAVVRNAAVALPNVRLVVLGAGAGVSDVLAYLEAGAVAYVMGEDTKADLLTRIRDAVMGRLHCAPEVAAGLRDRVQTAIEYPGRLGIPPDLTPREAQIMELLARRLSNKEIAELLHIGVGTVKHHVHNIFEKQHFHHRSEARPTSPVTSLSDRPDQKI